MPRVARKQSSTQIYHVMLRGINKQNIFEEAEDYQKMMEMLQYCIEKSGIEIYAYCLMTNHIHLLMKEGNEPLSITFRRFGSKFVYWYNAKYNRTGHLFQDRFKSEAVEDDSYFLTVMRYIHLNPVKGGLVKRAEAYPYSSYHDYLKPQHWVNTQKVFSMITVDQYLKMHQTDMDENCLDLSDEEYHRVTEEQAKKLMKLMTECNSVAEFQALSGEKKKQYIKQLKKSGISFRQISRMTGESYYKVQKM